LERGLTAEITNNFKCGCVIGLFETR